MTSSYTRQSFRPQMSLYIPSVTPTTDEEQIKYVFKILDLGVVSRVDFVNKENGNMMAFVHMDYWMINNSSYHLQERIVNEGQAKIVYNDPYYWIVMENKNPRTQAEIELENRVKYLESKVSYFEKVIETHTRRLFDNNINIKGQTCSECWTVYVEDENGNRCPACDFNMNDLVITVNAEGQRKITEYYKETEDDVDDKKSGTTNDQDQEEGQAEAEALAMTGALGAKEITPETNTGGWWPFS